VAATNPARRIAAFMLAVALALAAPLVYDGWDADAAGDAIATFVIWTGVALIAFLMMTAVRAQRLSMRRGQEEAREEARLDQLTGVGNRRAFDEATALEIERARRLRAPLSILLVDIEDFKEINDHWGHVEGDRCLREVAAALQGQLRRPDLCFRWGGDEFALLLSGTDREGAQTLAMRLAVAVANCRRPDGEPILVRAGAAELRDGMDAAELVETADMALVTEKSRS
jgi:diguanylate cyclase (GGDEF)-like protein